MVRGFYAADGNAADTGASAGDVWTVRFAPPRSGQWRYDAALHRGSDIALSADPAGGQAVTLAQPSGIFHVVPNQREDHDWRTMAPLGVRNGYAVRGSEQSLWLKAGANSPENFLAYAQFDGTVKRDAEARDGEASGTRELRDFKAHEQDWRAGDITWRNGRGKGIVGAVNYLAGRGMNSVYFLTLNIGGDGNDVWPYADPDDPTRFDVSKLAQWNLLFTHMQRRGVVLHMVLQETENERWLDGGDTGRLRQLYFHEMIARFAHHPGLIWNLGEENGPADFSPDGQNDAQREAMIAFFERHDPYHHPVVLHTHASEEGQDEILTPLLGRKNLHGLSLQVDDPKRVNHDVAQWRARSQQTPQPWWISMDEVGPWHTGATPDALDPAHNNLRRHVLWGALLAGAGGIEWYFGARQPRNDLTADDWRTYDTLWRQTALARDFMQGFDLMRFSPCNAQAGLDAYCYGHPDDTFLIYPAPGTPPTLDLSQTTGSFDIQWFDTVSGGDLQHGSVRRVGSGGRRALGTPPPAPATDWLIVVQRHARP